jgi:hypothetical protein
VTDVDTAGKTLVFDRTPLARLISCAATFGSAALFFDALSRYLNNRVSIIPVIGFALLFVGTLFSALLQYGDHIYLSPEGLLYENRWLPFIARRSRWLRWDDVVEVREVRRKILILLARDGRRMLVDAIAGYMIARREILRRAPHAVISGTLTREDRQ